jgi:anti-sigma-K factor RskA
MAQIIHLDEFQEARREMRKRAAAHAHLARALEILKENLADAAAALRDAPPEQESELLARVEKLTAMVRYGARMLGEGRAYEAG